ncbi:MAG: DNA repair protein RadA [Deltaproteobacteria bacterium]|nr:MAG: DNA repair protein RadA [Deltaproteobacteria bacterium]
MARSKSIFRCTACDHQVPKWAGRCPSCGAWNTIEEVSPAEQSQAPLPVLTAQQRPIPLTEVALDAGGELRMRTGLEELDRVLGGGLVAGSLTLLGGDPGVGKSTLLLMAAERFAKRGVPVLYATGEESARQIRLRADRLGIHAESLLLLPCTDFDVIEAATRESRPVVLVVDSVQTVRTANASGIPGSVSQIREVAHRAMNLAKGQNIATWLVGHVTRSGDLAGPKVLEHFVDTVLYFEGDGRSALRILRSVKNRFGAAGELGIFEMIDKGLRQVPDASARLLEERDPDAPGTAVVATLEGSRPLLAEVQALVGAPGAYTPARTCVGVDRARVLMLAAVLGKHGFSLHDRDIFVNAAGGVRLDEPAADLAILCALTSTLTDRPLPRDTVIMGEVGLVGEIRGITHPAMRLREAERHGFRAAIAPASAAEHAPNSLEVLPLRRVREVLDRLRR